MDPSYQTRISSYCASFVYRCPQFSSSCSFFLLSDRSNSELDAQREVVLNMLLKLIVYPQAIETVIVILGAIKAEGEER